MMRFALLVAGFAVLNLHDGASAHMEMTWPPPLRSKYNPFANGDIDYSMTSPLSADGSNFPCKGNLGLLGKDAGKPVTTYQAGQSYNFTIEGGANHNGGSCQAALSFDKGQTFKVIKSYIGNCPPAGASKFDFTVPDDAPTAEDAIFAWTWFNQVGNREMYMNCAVVSTQGGGNAKRAVTAFNTRPNIFVANVGNGCSTAEGSDLEFPSPGPDVDEASSKTSGPQGTCADAGAGNPPPNNNPGEGTNGGAPPSPSKTTTPSDPVDAPPKSGGLVQPTATPEQPNAGQPAENTLPGGIFMPQPSVDVPQATSEVPQQPSTLSTVVVPEPSIPPPQVSEAPQIPNKPAPDAESPGILTPGISCANEGQWNCIGGSKFQRCASGQWSQVLSMAAGTSCASGISDVLVISKKRSIPRRFLAPWNNV